MNVYFRTMKGKTSMIHVDVACHKEAVLAVKEELVATGEGYSGAVLAAIDGGKIEEAQRK